MAKVPDLRRITTEEFPEEIRESIEKLGIILNQYMQENNSALNGNLDNFNLNRDIKNFNVNVTSDGIPKSETLIKHKVKGQLKGLYVIKVQNLSPTATYLTGAPFVEFTTKGDLLRVLHITGLTPDVDYNVQVEIIG